MVYDQFRLGATPIFVTYHVLYAFLAILMYLCVFGLRVCGYAHVPRKHVPRNKQYNIIHYNVTNGLSKYETLNAV